MNEKEIKQHLLTLSKEQVIELYLQLRYEKEFLKTEILTDIYNEIMDVSYFQASIFGNNDMVINQTKFNEIFHNGGNNESTNITK